MNSTNTGQKAEEAAKVYLEMRGYKIVEQNYKRSRCEIDIVAQKDHTMYFVEVKYRRTDSQGSGLEYITGSKLRRMQFAAETWAEEYKWRGLYELSAIEIAGRDFVVLSFIDHVL